MKSCSLRQVSHQLLCPCLLPLQQRRYTMPLLETKLFLSVSTMNKAQVYAHVTTLESIAYEVESQQHKVALTSKLHTYKVRFVVFKWT